MKNGELPDSELVLRCRDGDQQAFETLYHRYRLPLYSYLNKLLPGQSARVDDFYQQTWLRVLDHLEGYREQQQFLSWLFRIAHNLVVDHFRREAKQEFVELDERLPDPGSAPWHALDDDQFRTEFEQAIAELAPAQREVVLLRQRGVPFKEIAEIQQTGLNTVLGRMHYAVQRLQARLAAWREPRGKG